VDAELMVGMTPETLAVGLQLAQVVHGLPTKVSVTEVAPLRPEMMPPVLTPVTDPDEAVGVLPKSLTPCSAMSHQLEL